MVRKLLTKILPIIASTALLASGFSGCISKEKEVVPEKTSPPAAQQSSAPAAQQSSAPAENTMPITKTPITLKYWTIINKSAAKILKNYSENAAYQELEKRTGIKIEFLHPPIGQEAEQFKLMIAAKDLPDIIQHYSSFSYPGGPDKAIEEGMYLKLNDYINKYAPNFKKVRESDKEIANETITDAGNIWSFPLIQTEDEPAWYGPVMRKDWLDELGLKAPTTVGEWYTVLKAFKEKKNVQAPFILPKSGTDSKFPFIGAYGVGNSFFKQGDKVKFGPLEQGYKEYLAEMNKWYAEGLIDKDFATRDTKTIDSMALTGKAGSWLNSYGSGIDTYLGTKKDDPKYALTATVYPSLKAGEKPNLRQVVWKNKGYEAVITTACKYPVEAVKLMDYHYSKDGFMLFNYGIENVSYKMVDGKPQFTDLLLKNPEGLPYDTVNWKYKVHVGPYLRDYKAAPELTKESADAQKLWNQAGVDGVLPPTSMSPAESESFSSVMSEINTYVDSMTLKFIIGTEPLSKFDSFVSQIKKMNIEEAIKIQQVALDRYNKR